ncbi:hypothetical protein [Enterobacter mori]|uniref:hypothetical protein n=1 Tax=Enterobacter mori TaxID=539813 RepID=UPI001EDFA406|nr:hypothetical protein [Enterobacter mori]
MRHVKLKNNILIGLACLIASFFIVLFPLGGLLDYLSQASNDFLIAPVWGLLMGKQTHHSCGCWVG